MKAYLEGKPVNTLNSSTPELAPHIGHAKVDLKFYFSNYFETSTLYGTIYFMKDVIVAFDKFLTNLDLDFEAIFFGEAFDVLKKALGHV